VSLLNPPERLRADNFKQLHLEEGQKGHTFDTHNFSGYRQFNVDDPTAAHPTDFQQKAEHQEDGTTIHSNEHVDDMVDSSLQQSVVVFVILSEPQFRHYKTKHAACLDNTTRSIWWAG
jgi:hypothetical protein